MAPSTMDFSMPRGILISVTFAGQGVRKKQPILSAGSPVFSAASFLAIAAAVSIGDFSGSTCSHKSGKRTRIKRTTAGQAGGAGNLKDVVKPHFFQSGQNIINIIQIVELPVQGRCGQRNIVFKFAEFRKMRKARPFGMMRTDADAFSAVDASFSSV